MTEPKQIKDFFVSDVEFESWLETRTKKELFCILRSFLDEEMYEDCVIIKKKIDEYK